jgi:hypothetical protein
MIGRRSGSHAPRQKPIPNGRVAAFVTAIITRLKPITIEPDVATNFDNSSPISHLQ